MFGWTPPLLHLRYSTPQHWLVGRSLGVGLGSWNFLDKYHSSLLPPKGWKKAFGALSESSFMPPPPYHAIFSTCSMAILTPFSFLAISPKPFELQSWDWSHSTGNWILHLLWSSKKSSRANFGWHKVMNTLEQFFLSNLSMKFHIQLAITSKSYGLG